LASSPWWFGEHDLGWQRAATDWAAAAMIFWAVLPSSSQKRGTGLEIKAGGKGSPRLARIEGGLSSGRSRRCNWWLCDCGSDFELN
jgi:hypothetical protein